MARANSPVWAKSRPRSRSSWTDSGSRSRIRSDAANALACSRREPPSVNLVQALLAVLHGQERSGVVRVDEQFLFAILVAHDEVTRQSYPGQRQPETPSQLQGNDRQRNGNPQAGVQDFVEKTVLGIVIVLPVTGKTHFIEQILIHHVKDLSGRPAACEPRMQIQSHFVQGLDILINIQIRIFFLGDQKRSPGQIDRAVGPMDQGGKVLTNLVRENHGESYRRPKGYFSRSPLR